MLLTLGEIVREYVYQSHDNDLIFTRHCSTDIVGVATSSYQNGLLGIIITSATSGAPEESYLDSQNKIGLQIEYSIDIYISNQKMALSGRFLGLEVNLINIHNMNLKNITAIYISGISQSISLSYREAALKIAKIAKDHNITVYYDPNYNATCWNDQGGIQAARSSVLEILPHIDVLLPKFPEDRVILPFDIVMPSHLLVVSKNGKNGITIHRFGQRINIPRIKTNSNDEVFNNDKWNGCFIALHQKGLPIKECIKLANTYAFNISTSHT